MDLGDTSLTFACKPEIRPDIVLAPSYACPLYSEKFRPICSVQSFKTSKK